MSAIHDALALIEGALDTIRSSVEGIRSENPDEVALIDAQIFDLQNRRAALTGWQPTEVGDWALVREVARYRKVPGSGDWWQESTDAWDPGQVTSAEMAGAFGPDWTHVVALVRRAAGLTADQRSAYYAAVNRVYNEDRKAWDKAWRAVCVGGGPGGAAHRALVAGGDGDGGAVVGEALARRAELIATKDGQEHYDVLTRAWRETFEPIHPGDDS